MFGSCSKLKSLDLSRFNTSNAVSLYNLFYDCISLNKINISSFDTSKVTSMEGCFIIVNH